MLTMHINRQSLPLWRAFALLLLILSMLSKESDAAVGFGEMHDGILVDPIPLPITPEPTTPPPTLAPTLPLAPSIAPVPTVAPSAVTFYVVGDVPYSDMEACLLPFELQKMDPSAFFLIHLGDIRDGKPDPITGNIRECPETMFQELETIFESSDLVPFFIPGDNAWLDCANATEAYEYWEKYLFNYNERSDLTWSPFPTALGVHRWGDFTPGTTPSTRRSEFFAFLIDKVLFVGLSLPGSGRDMNNEWTPRDTLLSDNIDWTEQALDAYSGTMEAVVLFGHASASINAPYFEALRTILTEPEYSSLPFLFLEDNHFFNVKEGFLGVPNLLQIEQDDTVTPMKITVDVRASALKDVFRHDQGCLCSTGHRPTRLITYVDSDPCGGECIDGFNACQGENRCSPEGAVCPDP